MRAIYLVIALFGMPAMAEAENDPFEGWNRAMFSFNQKADKYVLKPVAEGYQAVTPAPVRKGVSNFFNNLGEPITAANSVLRPSQARRRGH